MAYQNNKKTTEISAKQLSSVNLKDKLKIVNKIYISYPRFKEVLSAIDYCHHFSSCKDEPECMFLSGRTGVGKTTIYKTYARKYPRRVTQISTKVPILSAAIPVPATVKAVVTKLLWELGDPAYNKGTTVNQTIRLINLIKDCQVELLILDEFQHFIDRDSAKVLKTVSDWLKNFILDTNIPIILVGLPESEQILRLQSQSQLSRRFANRYYLPPFEWQSDEGEEFRTFLHLLESSLPLEKPSNLSALDTSMRFYYASDGVIAYVMKLIRYGTYLAFTQEQESLNSNVLAAAFEKYVRADKPNKVNPFISDDFEIKSSKKVANKCVVGATNNRIKPKSKNLKAIDVLKTK